MVQLDVDLRDRSRDHNLIVHIHTSPGAASDIDAGRASSSSVSATTSKIHLVHLGGGMSGHIKLIGGLLLRLDRGRQAGLHRYELGDRLRTPLARRRDRPARYRRHDRILFASDEPWGDHAGEYARLASRRPATASSPSTCSPTTSLPSTTDHPFFPPHVRPRSTTDPRRHPDDRARRQHRQEPRWPRSRTRRCRRARNIYGSTKLFPGLSGLARVRRGSRWCTGSHTSLR